MSGLTRRQREVIEAIRGLTEEFGYPPTIRELACYFGLSINAVAEHLKLLRNKGAVAWEPRQCRTLRVVERSEQANEVQ